MQSKRWCAKTDASGFLGALWWTGPARTVVRRGGGVLPLPPPCHLLGATDTASLRGFGGERLQPPPTTNNVQQAMLRRTTKMFRTAMRYFRPHRIATHGDPPTSPEPPWRKESTPPSRAACGESRATTSGSSRTEGSSPVVFVKFCGRGVCFLRANVLFRRCRWLPHSVHGGGGPQAAGDRSSVDVFVCRTFTSIVVFPANHSKVRTPAHDQQRTRREAPFLTPKHAWRLASFLHMTPCHASTHLPSSTPYLHHE